MLDMCISALVATWVVCWRAEECPSVCPSAQRRLYTALYSSGESTDDIYSVYGMFVMLDMCISALVGTWAVRNRVMARRGVSVYLSVSSSRTLHGLVH